MGMGRRCMKIKHLLFWVILSTYWSNFDFSNLSCGLELALRLHLFDVFP